MRIGRSRSRLVTVALAALAAVGLTIGTAVPASASAWSDPQGRELRYVALGDSYAAGQGTDCTHTASSYPRLLDLLPSVKLVSDVSCAGATTATVITSQLGAVNQSVGLVTVTVGANDLDVVGLESVCAANPASATCAAAIQARQAQLPTLFANLAATYTLIAAASPEATIFVTGYAPLVSTGPLYTAEQALNSTIQGAVTRVSAAGAHIHYVAVAFTGHTVDSPHPWFFLAGPNIFHPTWQGNLAYAAAITRSLQAVVDHH
jgi:lysophospholipase L1-like esterase